jgi:hypothetical protein
MYSILLILESEISVFINKNIATQRNTHNVFVNNARNEKVGYNILQIGDILEFRNGDGSIYHDAIQCYFILQDSFLQKFNAQADIASYPCYGSCA